MSRIRDISIVSLLLKIVINVGILYSKAHRSSRRELVVKAISYRKYLQNIRFLNFF
ncbi:hypothetical protein PPE03_07070 [Pseudoalteromonas peptidolytica]|nr:hypothetical protein PPE03_07070 [Pseudoalteromonas peptidolytica]